MKLLYTPKSHYARKVRILIDALSLPVKLVDIVNVTAQSAAHFGGNPLLKVPCLLDEDQVIIESDYIAQYLMRKFALTDTYRVMTQDPEQLNVRAVMNGVMAAEVEIILAERSGLKTQGLPRFDKHREAVQQGLQWLEDHSHLFAAQPTYAGFHLVSLWDHLVLYGDFALPYPKLQAVVQRLAALDFVARSAP